MTAPIRSSAERAAALDRALQVRRERAALRVALKSGSQDGRSIIADSADDATWHAVRVRWLLESLPGIGPIRAQGLLEACAIALTRRLGGLTPRQRTDLLAALTHGSR